jgi:hypothetical protein
MSNLIISSVKQSYNNKFLVGEKVKQGGILHGLNAQFGEDILSHKVVDAVYYFVEAPNSFRHSCQLTRKCQVCFRIQKARLL